MTIAKHPTFYLQLVVSKYSLAIRMPYPNTEVNKEGVMK